MQIKSQWLDQVPSGYLLYKQNEKDVVCDLCCFIFKRCSLLNNWIRGRDPPNTLAQFITQSYKKSPFAVLEWAVLHQTLHRYEMGSRPAWEWMCENNWFSKTWEVSKKYYHIVIITRRRRGKKKGKRKKKKKKKSVRLIWSELLQ